MYTGVTRYAQVTGVAVCSLSLTWISTILRFYVRIGILKFFGREDWLTVAAIIFFTIFCSLCLRANVYGLGAHMYNIPDSSLVTGFKITFICELLYVVSTTVTKLSIAAYFLRLSSKRYQKLVIYTTLSIVFLFSTMYFFFLLFQCTPINYLWTMYQQGTGSCLSKNALANVTYAHSAMSAATDWAFGILPIFFVWNMQMNPRTKLSVVLILSLGFFASTATIVRIFYIERLTLTPDLSWEGINLVKWSMVEPAIAITAMNIATLRPMFKNFFLFTSKHFVNNSPDTSHSYDPDEERQSGDSSMTGWISNRESRYTTNTRSTKTRTWNSVRANEYSAEFAEMLGLSRLGVTTEITAGGGVGDRERSRRRYGLRVERRKGEKRGSSILGGGRGRAESQMELSFGLNGAVAGQGCSPGSTGTGSSGASEWLGIQCTTTIQQVELKE